MLSVLFLLINCILLVPGCFGEYRQTALAENISDTLNGLLLNYDKHIRPNFSLKPTLIEIDLNIRSMGPISERKMIYSFDCYFRQTWRDDRLGFIGAGSLQTLQLNERMLQKIWKPDTYIHNGRGSYIHNITSLNVLFRIQQNGDILYSMRLTIKASCPMHLQKFPMDKQHCPLVIGSHGYLSDDLVYDWRKGVGKSVEVSKDLSLSQFDLKSISEGYDSIKIGNRGLFSMVTVLFELERNMGYFLIQLYLPCTLLVILSWVGFWINREATSDRIALGITTVLTMAFLGTDNRQDLPRVPYSTALDIYVGTCFAFILATIIQFSGVHYFTKYGSGEIQLQQPDSDDDKDNTTTLNRPNRRNGSYALKDTSNSRCYINPNASGENDSEQESLKKIEENKGDDILVEEAVFRDNCCIGFINCLQSSVKYKEMKLRKSDRKFNSVSKIDRLARLGFPLAFISFNVLYWVFYLKF